MSNTLLNNCLYIFNGTICIPGIIMFSYYLCTNLDNKSLDIINCRQMLFLSFITMINSIICLACTKKYKYIGFNTTLALFVYKSYNIIYISNMCNINNNSIWYYYIFCLILNGINIVTYIIALIQYTVTRKQLKIININDDTINENIYENTMYDVHNNLIND